MKPLERVHASSFSGESELKYFRLVLGSTAVAYILFGLFYRVYVPGEIPMSLPQRLGAAGFFLVLAFLTYISRWARENVEVLMYLAASGAFAHLVYFAYINDYSLNYALSILVVIIVLNFLFKGNIKLKWFNVVVSLGVAASIFLSRGISYSGSGFVVAVISISAVSYYLSRSKHLAQEEYEQLFEDSPIGLVRCNRDGEVRNVNREMLKLAGSCPEGKLTGLNMFEILGLESDDFKVVENREALLELPWDEKVWVEFSVELIPKGEKTPRDIIIAFRDITERKRAEDKIEYISYHDDLTDLYNRSFYQQKAEIFDRRDRYPFSVIFIDVDKLKLVNDAFGHQTGDRLLKRAAEVVSESCREEDFVFRWGGDEIVILLPEISNQESRKIASRVRKNCRRTEFGPIGLRLSLGCASASTYRESVDLNHLLKEAEEKMYENKMEKQVEVTREILEIIENKLKDKAPCVISHEKRVRDYSLKVGEELGLESEQLERLGAAARYHDIGRVSIGEDLLNKEYSDMSAEEKEEVRSHSSIGYQIAKEIHDISDYARPILQHHEWWNGQGYPQGKSKNEISLNSRIIAVANYYDYLVNPHCNYREKVDKKEAVEKINSGSGTRFDPEIADTFVRGI
jgi:diguanylate cyclase (GGDEF)-like protein/PAS domain S-box-containing protein